MTKTVKRYGNSGGVYVPSSWVGGTVRIELVDEPADIRRDILKIPLEHVVSVILYGSHARKEAGYKSDIDVLLVTDEDAKIELSAEIRAKYDIHVKSITQVRNAMTRDPVFYKTITDEGTAIINHQFLDDVRRLPKPADVKKRLELIESSLKVVKEIFAAGLPEEAIYPIVMRLKEILLIQCFLSGKKYSSNLLKSEILKAAPGKESAKIMNAYRAARSGKTVSGKIPKDIVEKMILLLEKKIMHVRKSAGEKRDRTP